MQADPDGGHLSITIDGIPLARWDIGAVEAGQVLRQTLHGTMRLGVGEHPLVITISRGYEARLGSPVLMVGPVSMVRREDS